MFVSAVKAPGNSLKMIKVLLTLVVVCALFHQYVTAQEDECEEDGKKIKASVKETMGSGEVACNDEYDLGRFQWADDKSDEQQKKEELKAWISEKSEDEKQAVVECAVEMIKKGIEKVEGEIDGDCLEKLKFKMTIFAR